MSENLGLVNFSVMMFFVIIQSYYYFKVNPSTKARFPVMLAITGFSMMITPLLMSSIDSNGDLFSMIGTPFVQLFFILYQVLLFFFSAWEYKLVKRG